MRPFLTRHPVSVQVTGWCVLVMAVVLDGYLNLPKPFSVPLSVYVALVGAPLIVAASLRPHPPPLPFPNLCETLFVHRHGCLDCYGF